LSLPKTVSTECIESRRSFLKVVDQLYREKVETAEHRYMDSFTDQALKMLLAPSMRKAFDLSEEPEIIRDSYGRDKVGQSLLLARRLVEAGSRFVTAAGFHYNAWDTHGDNNKKHKEELTPALDRALSALLLDLEQRGLFESTIVVAMGEFGRTPHLNPNSGRDHWPHCWSLAIGGGGLRGGQIVGASDEQGAQVAERRISIGDVYATIYKALGIDWEKEYMTPVGRPVKIANSLEDRTGEPITELI
jgi:hypothetical protein